MSNKLINEYNNRAELEIAEYINRNPTVISRLIKKIEKLPKISKDLKQLSNLPEGDKKAKLHDTINKNIKNELAQNISDKYIRTYRTIIDELFDAGLVDTTKTTITYLRDHIRAPGARDGRLLPKRVSPGMFYMYLYDPKGKASLDYYDSLPLVLVLSTTKTGFTGLNMHLIAPEHRLKIYNLMLLFKRGIRYRTNLQIVWNIIKNVDRFRLGRPIIRSYLYSHIRSKITRVPVDDWEIMLLLPSLRLNGMQSAAVYKENKKKAFS